MIRYNPRNWFTLIFEFHRAKAMRYILPNALMLGAYSAGVAYFFLDWVKPDFHPKMTIHSLIGIVLGLVLVFRTNTAYDRWWEGRKLWGALINHSRSLALKVSALLPDGDTEARKFFAASIANFAASTRDHLRESPNPEGLDLSIYPEGHPYLSVKHIPNQVIRDLQERLVDMNKTGKISNEQYLVLTRETDGMIDCLGGCERILRTPIPYSYSMYIKRFIFLYLITLPIGLIDEFKYYSIAAVMLLTYILVGIELLAEEVEEPFGTDANDLDTDGMSATIHVNAMEILRVG